MSVLKRIERQIGNMNGMLSRVGIDAGALMQDRLRGVFTTSLRACLSCPNGDICSGWLDHAQRTINRVPEFCPNARRFEAARASIRRCI